MENCHKASNLINMVKHQLRTVLSHNKNDSVKTLKER